MDLDDNLSLDLSDVDKLNELRKNSIYHKANYEVTTPIPSDELPQH